LRIGVHTGSVVSGIIGKKTPKFWLWGEDCHIAKKMESSGEAGRVHVSATTYELISQYDQCPHSFEKREAKVQLDPYRLKMQTYWLAEQVTPRILGVQLQAQLKLVKENETEVLKIKQQNQWLHSKLTEQQKRIQQLKNIIESFDQMWKANLIPERQLNISIEDTDKDTQDKESSRLQLHSNGHVELQPIFSPHSQSASLEFCRDQMEDISSNQLLSIPGTKTCFSSPQTINASQVDDLNCSEGSLTVDIPNQNTSPQKPWADVSNIFLLDRVHRSSPIISGRTPNSLTSLDKSTQSLLDLFAANKSPLEKRRHTKQTLTPKEMWQYDRLYGNSNPSPQMPEHKWFKALPPQRKQIVEDILRRFLCHYETLNPQAEEHTLKHAALLRRLLSEVSVELKEKGGLNGEDIDSALEAITEMEAKNSSSGESDKAATRSENEYEEKREVLIDMKKDQPNDYVGANKCVWPDQYLNENIRTVEGRLTRFIYFIGGLEEKLSLRKTGLSIKPMLTIKEPIEAPLYPSSQRYDPAGGQYMLVETPPNTENSLFFTIER